MIRLLPLLASLPIQEPALEATPRIDHAVIVHSENSVESLSSRELRRIFRAEKRFWATDDPIELFLPRAGSQSKQALLDHVYGMTSVQLKRHWMEQIYQNRISDAPRALSSPSVAKGVVQRLTNAITIVPDADVDQTIQVVAVDEREPGESNYALRTGGDPSEQPSETSGRARDASTLRRRSPLHARGPELDAIDDVLAADDRSESDWPPLNIRLFAHGEYEYEEATEDDETSKESGFSIEVVDVLITSEIDDHLSVLAETVYEAQDEGDYRIEVERLLLKYQATDTFGVQMGRFLTGIGYWNSRYHHGEWLQTSIDRPEVIDFEDDGGLLPIHSVGLSAQGVFFMDAAAVDYTIEVANGRGPTPDFAQLKEDANRAKAINLRLGIEPEGLPGLRFGAGLYVDKIPTNDEPDDGPEHGRLDETIQTFFLAYNDLDWEMMAEYFHMEHEGGGRTADSNGWYAQVGRHFADWTPYVRVDGINRDDQDTYFEELGDGFTTAVGLRYDLGRSAALTLQYEDADLDPGPGEEDEDTETLVFQISVAF